MNDSRKTDLEVVQVFAMEIESENDQQKESESSAETASNNYHQFFSNDD